MTPVQVHEGDSPVILGLPHTGTHVPPGLWKRLNPLGQTLADTDWHIERLYDGLLPGATTVRATFHRYVIDANRPPDGASLYPGQNTTGLCPVTDFDGHPIWVQEPGADEIEDRRARFHAPYHAALAEQVARVHARHGYAVLYDCHSIRSRIPFLFDGDLPVFNIGTLNGTTCAGWVQQVTARHCRASGLPTVENGRFKGGWTTRHYGRPADGIHAIQMELAQRAYLAAESPPWTYAAPERLRATLRAILSDLADGASL
jgi:formiminoglutamase